MSCQPFIAQPVADGLGRIPLLAAEGDNGSVGSPLLAEAVFLASRQMGLVVTENQGNCAAMRAAVTMRGYELRARLRPTPHGAFAGVAQVRFAARPATLRLGSRHRARSNPSGAWLTAVAASLLDEQGVLPLLKLTANNLVIRRGLRMEHEQPADSEVAAPRRITVRASAATLLAVRICASGATFDQVVTEVADRWPQVPGPIVRSMVLGLIRTGFLLSDLLPDDVGNDPLGHIMARLPEANRKRRKLACLRDLLAEADRYPPGDSSRLPLLRSARDLADEICFLERPLTVDVAADAELTMPISVADEAARAAGVLWQISPARDHLTGYHAQFLERYGRNRLVPLLDVIDQVVGLGTDFDTADNARDTDQPSGRSDRAEVLTDLLARASRHGGIEVRLDAKTIAALGDQDGGRQAAQPPPTAEVYVRVLASNADDLANGRLFLAVSPDGGSQTAGSTSGRFVSLLPYTPSNTGSEPYGSPALIAELVVRPRVAHATTLVVDTGRTSWRIPIGIPTGPRDLALDDLLLVSDGDRLTLWSASQDRQVVPVLYSMLSPHLLPPVARFLRLLGWAGCRPWRGWSWGPLADLPFQPRVRYGTTVLSPARWVLPPALAKAAGHRDTWDTAVRTWQTTAVPAPPHIVVIEDADRRLPIDLRRPDDRELLRRGVNAGVRAVTEQPGGATAIQAVVSGPAGRHVLELVMPLTRRTTAASPPRSSPTPVRKAGVGLYLPGSEWLSLAVRCPADWQDDMLRGLAEIAAEMSRSWDRWFWLRYSDPAHGPHIRARFHGQPAVLGGELLPKLSAWGTEMITQRLSGGFTLLPYDQEIERYGGQEAMSAAERVFAVDSQLVFEALAATADPDDRLVIAAVSAAAIAEVVASGATRMLRGHRLDRAARQHVIGLRSRVRQVHSCQTTRLSLIQPDHPTQAAWLDALRVYHDTLAPDQRTSCASAVIHMHADRLLGDKNAEHIARTLAADLLAFRALAS